MTPTPPGSITVEQVRQQEAALDPITPAETLARLSRNPNAEIRERVARNRMAPPELLARLAQDANSKVRSAAAKHPAIPAWILRDLAQSGDDTLRSAAASNCATPHEILNRLAEDADMEVRAAVALNRATPADTLRKLAQDRTSLVRWNVAQNCAVVPEILLELAANDHEDQVRWAALTTTKALPESDARKILIKNHLSKAYVEFTVIVNPLYDSVFFKSRPEMFFSRNVGPIISVTMASEGGDIHCVVSLLRNKEHEREKDKYRFFVGSPGQAEASYDILLDYIVRGGYLDEIKSFNLEYADFKRDLERLRKDCSVLAIRLPDKPPVKWPGSRKADLIDFLRENYGRYFGRGLTMAWLRDKDWSLYQAILNHKRRVGPLPPDVKIPSQREALDSILDKFFSSGKKSLTPKEKIAVGRKARRLAGPSP
jgi:hypothetical protein